MEKETVRKTWCKLNEVAFWLVTNMHCEEDQVNRDAMLHAYKLVNTVLVQFAEIEYRAGNSSSDQSKI
jgi:hypothetical protein